MKRTAIKCRPRRSTPEERAHYKRIHQEIEFCVLCGQYGITVAHRNEGKPLGRRVVYTETAALCWPCHVSLDQYKNMTRDESRRTMRIAIERTKRLLGMNDGCESET